MADGEIRIDTKVDTSGLDKGLKTVQQKMNNTSKSMGTLKTAFNSSGGAAAGFAKQMGNVAATGGPVAAAIAAAVAAAKKYFEILKEGHEAYKAQEKAEKALAQAAKNNPYLDGESVAKLKAYAGELQKISNYGDESSIDVMAQLAATGRSESEIMKIMGAAADYAAAKHIDLASAAQTLNATYSGSAGLLGKQIDELKNLTDEQLKNGEAIDILAKKYKGLAESEKDSATQAKNAYGDFMEQVGKLTDKSAESFNEISKGFWESMAQGMESFNKSLENVSRNWVLGGINRDVKAGVKAVTKRYQDDSGNTINGAKAQNDVYLNWLKTELELKTKLSEKEKEALFNIDQELKYRARVAEYEQRQADAAAKRAEATANQKKANDIAAAFIKDNEKALNAQIETMRVRAELTGEEIDAGAMYNAYMQSYIDLLTKSNGLVTKNNQAAKARLAALQEWAEKAKDAADAERLLAEADQLVAKYADKDVFEAYAERQRELEEMRRAVDEKEVQDAREKADRIKAIDEEMAENRRRLWASLGGEINDYAQQIDQIVQNAANMALETENNRMKAELANLELKYRKGEMGEEEYQEKVAEAKKKGAKIQYQIEMAQWASNILAATANTAVGVTQALAQGGVAGIITGALVGAAGAVQLAAILGAKPIPHFASGGFVGGMNGASLGADNTLVAARGGELMVNASQQRELWDVLNGGARGTAAGGVSFTVNNSASNLVTATPQINRNQIELMIDARVNESLKDGRYNDGLNAAQAGMSGTFYGL